MDWFVWSGAGGHPDSDCSCNLTVLSHQKLLLTPPPPKHRTRKITHLKFDKIIWTKPTWLWVSTCFLGGVDICFIPSYYGESPNPSNLKSALGLPCWLRRVWSSISSGLTLGRCWMWRFPWKLTAGTWPCLLGNIGKRRSIFTKQQFMGSRR